MRGRLVLLFALVALPAMAQAEKVKTNAPAKVYNRAGEQGKVVVKVKEGQTMTVIGKEGRWLKVRVQGRTGYIPRSKVDQEDEEIGRVSRRRAFVDGRGTKRTFDADSAPDDRVGADATGDVAQSGDAEGSDDSASSGDDEGGDDGGKKSGGKKSGGKKSGGKKTGGKKSGGEKSSADDGDSGDDAVADDEPKDAGDAEESEAKRPVAHVSAKTVAYAEPSKESDEQFKAKPSDTLFVEEKKGKWTEVSVEDGDIGWIQTSKLELEDDGGGGGEGNPHGRVIDMRARLGFTLVSQSLTSTGGTTKWPDKYVVGSSSVAVMLSGALLYPYKKDYLVGGEMTYDLSKAIPGIAFDPDGSMGPAEGKTTGFTIHNVNVRGVVGYDLKKKSGAIVFGRLGYHYEAFRVDNVQDLTKNTARLPQENIKGPMIGAALAIPMLTEKIGLRVSLDAMLVGGSVSQTKNLEDGANPSVKKIMLGAGLTYRWKPGMDLSAGYDLNYASLSFGAPIATSMRMHTGTGVSRTDLNHTVAVGIAKAF